MLIIYFCWHEESNLIFFSFLTTKLILYYNDNNNNNPNNNKGSNNNVLTDEFFKIENNKEIWLERKNDKRDDLFIFKLKRLNYFLKLKQK